MVSEECLVYKMSTYLLVLSFLNASLEDALDYGLKSLVNLLRV